MADQRKVTIFEEAQKILDDGIKTYPKLSDFWIGLMWRLSRGPLNGGYRIRDSEPPTYVVRLHHWGVASIIVVYRFDATELHVVDLAIDPFNGG